MAKQSQLQFLNVFVQRERGEAQQGEPCCTRVVRPLSLHLGHETYHPPDKRGPTP